MSVIELSPEQRRQIAELLEHLCEQKRACAACGRMIWFVRSTRTRKLLPITDDGASHFKDCSDPNRFSKGGRR